MCILVFWGGVSDFGLGIRIREFIVLKIWNMLYYLVSFLELCYSCFMENFFVLWRFDVSRKCSGLG